MDTKGNRNIWEKNGTTQSRKDMVRDNLPDTKSQVVNLGPVNVFPANIISCKISSSSCCETNRSKINIPKCVLGRLLLKSFPSFNIINLGIISLVRPSNDLSHSKSSYHANPEHNPRWSVSRTTLTLIGRFASTPSAKVSFALREGGKPGSPNFFFSFTSTSLPPRQPRFEAFRSSDTLLSQCYIRLFTNTFAFAGLNSLSAALPKCWTEKAAVLSLSSNSKRRGAFSR